MGRMVKEILGGALYCNSPAGFLSFHEKGKDLCTDCKQATFSYFTNVFPPLASSEQKKS